MGNIYVKFGNMASKIGSKPVTIEKYVQVMVQDGEVYVKGPKGELRLSLIDEVELKLEEDKVYVYGKGKKAEQFRGLYRALINNMIIGVTRGFEKKLELVGVGYKASMQGDTLVLNVGYSHPVYFSKIEGISFSVQDNVITVSGIDKVKVGDVAASIRAVRPPEPYKGKGIRYLGEEVILKKSKGKK